MRAATIASHPGAVSFDAGSDFDDIAATLASWNRSSASELGAPFFTRAATICRMRACTSRRASNAWSSAGVSRAARRTLLAGAATTSGESPASSSGVPLFVGSVVTRRADAPTRYAGAQASRRGASTRLAGEPPSFSGLVLKLAGARAKLVGLVPRLAGARTKLVDTVPRLVGARTKLVDTVPRLVGARARLAGEVLELAGARASHVDVVLELAGARASHVGVVRVVLLVPVGLAGHATSKWTWIVREAMSVLTASRPSGKASLKIDRVVFICSLRR